MAYTFKDDGAALTYYREYNKEVGTGDKTLHTPPSNYVTTKNVPDPGYRVYTKPQKGAREKLLEERAWKLAQDSAPVEQPMPAELTSTHRADFEPKELPPPEERGARVMEGKPDLQWRKELRLVPPHMLDDPKAEVELPGNRSSFGRKTEFSTPIELAKSGIVKDC